MPEGSVDSLPSIEIKPLTPLAPEAYRDYLVQRKIIGYLGTGDPSVLDMDFYPITTVQKMDFSEGVMEGKYSVDILGKMLMNIESPLSQIDWENNLKSLASDLENSQEMERRILGFMGKEDVDKLTPAGIARFLEEYPTPADLEDYLDLQLYRAEQVSSDERLNLETTLKVFFERVYGDQFKYWQNFKLLVGEAFDEYKPTEVQKVQKKNPKLKILAGVGLSGLALVGGVDVGQVAFDNMRAVVRPEKSTKPEEIERAKLEESIEEKYGIRLVGMREGYQIAGVKFDENDPNLVGPRPPARWRKEQLERLNYLLSLLPERMYKEVDGKKLSLFEGDFGHTQCDCSGVSYWDSGVVGLAVDSLGDEDLEGDMSLLVHELTHRLDALTNNEIWEKVKKILGDSDFLRQQFMDPNVELKNKDMYGARATLGSFAPDQSFAEGIAGFSQLYVKGYDRFMRSLGPLIDGSKNEDLSGPNLELNYPKTHQIYRLYQEFFFEGKEYDEIARELNLDSDNEAEVISEIRSAEDIKREIKEFYGVVIKEDDEVPWDESKLSILLKSFDALSPNLSYPYSYWDGEKDVVETLNLSLGTDTLLIDKDTVTISASSFIDNTTAFVEIGSNLIQRTDGYDAAIKYLTEKEKLNIDIVQAQEMLKRLASLYLKGADQYFYGSNAVMDEYLQGVGKKYRKKIERRIDTYLRDGIFDGRGYQVGDKGITFFIDKENKINKIYWDK